MFNIVYMQLYYYLFKSVRKGPLLVNDSLVDE